MKMILGVCLAMMVVITTADFTVHVEEQDRLEQSEIFSKTKFMKVIKL